MVKIALLFTAALAAPTLSLALPFVKDVYKRDFANLEVRNPKNLSGVPNTPATPTGVIPEDGHNNPSYFPINVPPGSAHDPDRMKFRDVQIHSASVKVPPIEIEDHKKSHRNRLWSYETPTSPHYSSKPREGPHKDINKISTPHKRDLAEILSYLEARALEREYWY